MADLSPLQRQRRFLILMSLGVIAFYLLKAEVSNTATLSGVAVSLGRPEGVVVGLWIIWGWALLRYGQRVYELLSVVWCGVRCLKMCLPKTNALHFGTPRTMPSGWRSMAS